MTGDVGRPSPRRRSKVVSATPDRLQEVQARLRVLRRRFNLSDRHCEILALVVQGLSNKEVSERLTCSEVNVESHMTTLLRRTASASRSVLVARFWLEFDLDDQP